MRGAPRGEAQTRVSSVDRRTRTPPGLPDKVEELLGRFVGDLGAALASANDIVGDRLGLYQGLADGGSQTPGELAERTGRRDRA